MRVVPNESQGTGPFMVGTVEFLAWSGAGVEAAIPVPKTGEKRAEPAKQRAAKVRRDIVLGAEDCVSEFEVIGRSLGKRSQCNRRNTDGASYSGALGAIKSDVQRESPNALAKGTGIIQPRAAPWVTFPRRQP
jgi:hypothetical protein